MQNQRRASLGYHEFQEDVEAAIHAVEERLGSSVPESQKRFFAIKLLEKDDKIKEQMTNVPDVSREIKGSRRQI